MTAAIYARTARPHRRLRDLGALTAVALHRAAVLTAAVASVGLYALFGFTALWSGEWPHTHGVRDCPNHPYPADEIFPSVPSTFDPKGYGALYDWVHALLLLTPLAAIVWLVAALCLRRFRIAPQRRWNLAFVLAVAGLVLAVPLDVLEWWLD